MDITLYLTLDKEQLYKELVSTVKDLTFNIRQHATLSADYHVEFIASWAQSAGGNVSAKERDAEFQQKGIMEEIIQHKGAIDSLTAQRDLLLVLINA